MYKIQQIATSRKGSIIVAAEFEKKVYCWDLDTFKFVSEFNTILDFGGTRLAVTEDGTRCVAAAYSRYGVAMYDIPTGSVVWERKDIKKTQFLTFNPSDEKLYIGIEEKPMTVVNRYDGCDVEKLRAIGKIYFDTFSSKHLMLKGRQTVVGDGVKITSPTFAFLDVHAIGSGVVLSAVGNDLIYYDYSQQKIAWRVTTKDKEHFIKTAYSEKNNMIYSILYKYDKPRTKPYYLLYGITAIDGNIDFVFPLPPESCVFAFAHEAAKIICGSGEVFEISCDKPRLAYKFEWD